MEKGLFCLIICLSFASCGSESAVLTAYMKERGCSKIYEFCEGTGAENVGESPSLSPTPTQPEPVPSFSPTPTPTPQPTPTPTPTPIPPIREPKPQPEMPVMTAKTGDCKMLRWNDGRGGMLFLKSETQPGWKFLLPGLYGRPQKLFFCENGQCSAPNPPVPTRDKCSGGHSSAKCCGGFANPDHTPKGVIERWHACFPHGVSEIRVDDCPPLAVPAKCKRAGRCD